MKAILFFVLSIISFPLKAAPPIALTPLDLLAARHTANIDIDWQNSLSTNALNHLVQSRHMIVIIDENNNWSIASLSMELAMAITGEEGDYFSVQAAIDSPYFKHARCTTYQNYVKQNGPIPSCPPLSAFKEALEFAFTESNTEPKKRFQEWLGGQIRELDDADFLTTAAEDDNLSNLIDRAKAVYIQKEFERQQAATQFDVNTQINAVQIIDTLPNEIDNSPMLQMGDRFIASDLDNPYYTLHSGNHRLYVVPAIQTPESSDLVVTFANTKGEYLVLLSEIGTEKIQPLLLNEPWKIQIETAIQKSTPGGY